MKNKKIEVGHGERKKIMKAMGCSYPTLKVALEYASDTKKAQQIRKYAIHRGGVIIEYSINKK